MPRPQKIGVLTFHRCINYGSYWQARALADGLRARGLNAVLLDHQSARVDRAEWKNVFQPVRPRRTPRSDYPAYGRKARKFFDAFARLPLSRPFRLEAPDGMEPCDAIVVGSDEVWNLKHPWYAAYPLFFGDGLNAERVVSYAASFGCHDASWRLEAPWAERLRRFAALSVRDDNSQVLVREALGLNPALVLDPCLQFHEVCRRPTADESGVAIVYGHTFPDGFVQAARAWARARNIRLVSLGYRNDWADDQWLSAGPEEFAQAMARAQAVITNFFHGCVFALLNDKPFACTAADYRWHKVQALVRLTGTGDRLLSEGAPQSAYDAVLDHAPNGETRARLDQLRARSSAYLDHVLH